jgi:membrane dipeptidase
MTANKKSVEDRIDRLHAGGVVDFHLDMPMDLYEKRDRPNVLAEDYLPELEAGDISVLGAAIYIEDRYMPEMSLRVALDQISRVYAEAEESERFVICKSYREILHARKTGKIALLITMEGVEPLGTDWICFASFMSSVSGQLDLLYARRNAAGSGGIFAPTGSPRDRLTAFGRDVIRRVRTAGRPYRSGPHQSGRLQGDCRSHDQATHCFAHELQKIL